MVINENISLSWLYNFDEPLATGLGASDSNWNWNFIFDFYSLGGCQFVWRLHLHTQRGFLSEKRGLQMT